MSATEPQPTACFVTYYNGDCPICRPEIERYQRDATRDGVRADWVDIGTDDPRLQAAGIDRIAARQRLHVVDGEGRLHIGIDAFLVIWAALPGWRWLARIIGARPIKPMAVFLYDRVLAPLLDAFNRRRAGRAAASHSPG